jgi:hypothetical protein
VNRDLVFGAAGVVVAAGYYLLASAIPESALADAVGPQGLPRIYALVLAALSFILIVRSARRAPAPLTPAPVPRTPVPAGPKGPAPRDVAGMLAIGVVYLLVVPWLGYVVSLAGLILATTWYQGGVMRRQIVVVAVCGAIVFWLLFVLLLRIPHPPGVWAALF